MGPDTRVARAFEFGPHALASVAGEDGIDVGDGAPLRLAELDRTADGVAEEDGPLRSVSEDDDQVAGRVSGCGHGRDARGDDGIAVDQHHSALFEPRLEAFAHVGQHLVGTFDHEVLPVPGADPDGRIGEDGLPAAVDQPAAMIDMQVRADHGIHVLQSDTGHGQLTEQPSTDETLGGHLPQAGVDQDGPVAQRAAPEDETTDGQMHLAVGRQEILMAVKGHGVPEVLGSGDDLSVVDRRYLQIADLHGSHLIQSAIMSRHGDARVALLLMGYQRPSAGLTEIVVCRRPPAGMSTSAAATSPVLPSTGKYAGGADASGGDACGGGDLMEWALLSVLAEAERRDLLARGRRRRYAKGEVIFHEGDPGDTLHLLAKGRVTVRLTTALGDVTTLRIISPGGWFGELALLCPAPRNATIVALEPVETMTLRRDDIAEVRERSPAFEHVLAEALVAEVRRLSTALLEALFVPVDKRILRRVAELAALYRTGDLPAVIPLTQEEVAQLAGTTRPTVNKVLQSAAGEGLLSLRRGQIEVPDGERLARRGR